MRRFGVGLAALLALGFVAVQAKAPIAAETETLDAQTMVDWSGAEHTYAYGDVTLDIAIVTDADEISRVSLTVAAPGYEDVGVSFEAGFGPYGLIGVYPLDESGADTILFTVYSGGAHCCQQTTAITITDEGFVVADVGAIDGDYLEPGDVDGDGKPELVLYDDRFNYTFAAYAFSVSPELIYTFRNGQMVEVSRDARYAGFYRARMAEMARYCSGDTWQIADCAAYVATAALLGEYNAAFDKVEAAWAAGKFDPESGWETFSFCADPTCDTLKDYTDFPEALMHGLAEWGYLDAAGAIVGDTGRSGKEKSLRR